MNLSAGESANSSSAITASEARPTAVVHRPVPSPNAAPAVHPPKVELFDISERTNTDPKGFVRPVDVYLRRPWGLYMARPADHRQFHYLESWLLPSVGLRASIFHFNTDFTRDQSHYVDIGDFVDEGTVWRSEDHYLDLVVRTGQDTELLDVDELFDARIAGLLTAETAERAVHRAVVAIDGIASHGHDLGAWLGSLGMTIEWRDSAKR